jgi:hypothetical protein
LLQAEVAFIKDHPACQVKAAAFMADRDFLQGNNRREKTAQQSQSLLLSLYKTGFHFAFG